jgi:NitT/TauT family transport system substrate-binding protein
MPITQTRRRLLTTLSMAGAAGLVRAPRALAAEGALETTSVRLSNGRGICVSPQWIAEELLRAEGFTDIPMWKYRRVRCRWRPGAARSISR